MTERLTKEAATLRLQKLLTQRKDGEDKWFATPSIAEDSSGPWSYKCSLCGEKLTTASKWFANEHRALWGMVKRATTLGLGIRIELCTEYFCPICNPKFAQKTQPLSFEREEGQGFAINFALADEEQARKLEIDAQGMKALLHFFHGNYTMPTAKDCPTPLPLKEHVNELRNILGLS